MLNSQNMFHINTKPVIWVLVTEEANAIIINNVSGCGLIVSHIFGFPHLVQTALHVLDVAEIQIA
ncbi:MAG: hypothetical protein AAF434_17130 [Pseudomonadota bacterium]